VRDPPPGAAPSPVSAVFTTRVKPGQEDAFRAWEQRVAAAQAQEVHIVHAGQHGLHLREQLLPHARMQPGHGRVGRFEALQDHPIDLRRRIRRHHRLLDEPGQRRDYGAHARLQFRERFVLAALGARLDDDDDWCVSSRVVQGTEDSVLRQRQTRKAHAGRIHQRIGDRRRDRIDCALTLRLGAERADPIVGVGEHLLARRRIGKGRDAVVAQAWIDHGVLGQRPADPHADRAVDLPAALHRIDQPPDISGVNAV
jgi:hypothetical protein